MKTTLLKNFLTICVLVFSVGAINAQVITWTGATDTNFLNTANWDLGTIPNSTSDVTIAASTNSSIYNMALSTVDSENSNNYISHLIIQSGGQLTVSAPINITSGGNNYTGGNLKLEDGGSMNFRNALYLGVTSNPATVNIDGGTFNSKSYLIIGERSDCTININGGTVSVDQNSNGRAIIIGNYYAVGIVNLNEGTLKTNPLLNGTAALTIAENGKGDPNATGYLMIDNGTLQMGGNQQTFVQGYVTADKIKPAAGKEIVITYDAISDVTYVTAAAPKEILYVQKTGFASASEASTSTNDPIIRMFTADANFNITVVETDATGTGLDLTGYDLVIAQETFSSGDGIWKPAGPLGIKKLTIPVIYNKSWAFRDGLAVTDSDATMAISPALTLTVDPANQDNPLFNGITFAGNDIALYNETSDNYGGTGTNSIDVLNGLDISETGTLLGTNPNVTDADKAIVVNDIPAGTTLGTEGTDVLPSRMIAFAFNYGAIIKGDGANITSEALTIWRNAAYVLTGLTAPSTLYVNPDYVTLGIDKVGEASNVSTNVQAIGNRIYVSNVKSTSEINIYSITGALVKSFKTNEDTNFSFKSGLYIATVKTFEGAKSIKLLMK